MSFATNAENDVLELGDDDFASNAENGSGKGQRGLETKRITDLQHNSNNTSTSEDSFKNATTRNRLSSTTEPSTPITEKKTTEFTEPAKPLSSYALFFKATTAAIKKENPNCTFQELSQIALSLWNTLPQDEKHTYEVKHEAAKVEYVKQYNLFQQQKREREQQLKKHEATNGNVLQTKPAIFTITATTPPTQKPVLVVQQENGPDAGDSCSSNSSSTASSAIKTEQHQADGDGDSVPIKCIRLNCTNTAIVNPDWEDEYCSNECVVIHCRNVFNEYVQMQKEERKAAATPTEPNVATSNPTPA